MKKRLYRSRKDKIIAGVAGGIAEYFEIDPVIVRVLFVITALFNGIGLIAYIVLWIVAPDEYRVIITPTPDAAKESDQQVEHEQLTDNQKDPASESEKRGVVAGAILIGLGLIFLADNFFPFFSIKEFWPLVLVAIGTGLLLNANKRK